MDLLEGLTRISALLKAEAIPHALVGALAMAERGYLRATEDIDLLIDEVHLDRARGVFARIGYTIFHQSENVVQFEGSPSVDVLIARRPISRELLEHATLREALPIPCVSVEGIIGLKVQAYKNAPKRALRDQADIQSLIEANPSLDWSTVKKYADLFQEWPTIEEIRKRVES